MRFYYISILSVILLGVIYFVGTGLLVWLGTWLSKRWKHGWAAVMPLFLLLYIGPVAEEFWIAWNFGQLCKKDAGIFINKTVEVEGFYDDTHTWTERRMNEPAEPKFSFVEGRGQRSGKDVFWRHERVDGAIRSFEIAQPTARYHYKWPHMDTPVSYKVEKIERVVSDNVTGELLARETKYRRRAPWFFIGLDRPVMLCPGPGEHPLEKFGSVYNLALRPVRKDH